MTVDTERSAPVANLSAAKRALLEKRLRGEGSGTTASVIPRHPRNGPLPLPLSFAQERLWFIHQLAPKSPLYNISIPLRLSGPLHPTALQEALGAVVARHEALRTRFINQGGHPYQIVDAPTRLELRQADV